MCFYFCLYFLCFYEFIHRVCVHKWAYIHVYKWASYIKGHTSAQAATTRFYADYHLSKMTVVFFFSYFDTSFFPTHLEPVDGAAVDEGWELPEAVPEGVSDRGEGDDDVQVLAAPVHEEGEEGQGTEVCILVSSLGYRSHSLKINSKQH